LAKPGLHHVTQDGFVDEFGVQARAADGFGDGFRAQVNGR
jgi:hypothetical protein